MAAQLDTSVEHAAAVAQPAHITEEEIEGKKLVRQLLVSLDLVLREKSRRKSNHGCRFGKGSLSTMSSRRGKRERKERETRGYWMERCACVC